MEKKSLILLFAVVFIVIPCYIYTMCNAGWKRPSVEVDNGNVSYEYIP